MVGAPMSDQQGKKMSPSDVKPLFTSIAMSNRPLAPWLPLRMSMPVVQPGHTCPRPWSSIVNDPELDVVLSAFAPWEGALITKASFMLAWAENSAFRATCHRLEHTITPLYHSKFLAVFWLVCRLRVQWGCPGPCHCLHTSANLEGIRQAFLTAGRDTLSDLDLLTACRQSQGFSATLQTIRYDLSLTRANGVPLHLEVLQYVRFQHARLHRARQMMAQHCPGVALALPEPWTQVGYV